MMKASTVFQSGPSSQAVRIPKNFRIPTKMVWIKKVGDSLMITPKPESWDEFFTEVPQMTADFEMKHDKTLPQRRKALEK